MPILDTSADLPAQVLFDAALNTIRAQEGPAVDEGGRCRYLTEDGRRCAIGALIPFEEYRESFEGHHFIEFFGPAFVAAHKRLLCQLQEAHDYCAALAIGGRTRNPFVSDFVFLAAWEPRMAAIAHEFGLRYQPPQEDPS